MELLPQLPHLGLVQWDLLNLLSNRLPYAVCSGAATGGSSHRAEWSEARQAFR
jgi:hypothetical protein